MVFCYILWKFVIVCANLVYFFPLWYFVPRKIWQPWFQRVTLATGCERSSLEKRFADVPGKKIVEAIFRARFNY
jgi:hypothetical protein